MDLYEVMAGAARFFEQNLSDSERARDYLAKRGIDGPTSAKFALGYAADSWNALLNRFGAQEDDRRRLAQLGLIIERDQHGGERGGQSGFYDRFRDRLMFPIRDSRGRVLGFGGRVIDQGEPKYLNSPETPLFHKGRELYGLYEARQARVDFKRLLIVEGYMDVVRLHQAGVAYALATLGTATTQEHLHKIFRLTSELVFCFDGDRAGLQAAWRALENALPLAHDGREIKFTFLPDGHDPDTLVAAEGRDAFEARIRNALPLSEYLVQELLKQVDMSSRGRPRQARRAGRAPVRAHARRRLSRAVAGPARGADPHARREAQGSYAGRRAGGPPPGAAPRARGTNSADAQSDKRRAGQSAEPGDQSGTASPRRRVRGRAAKLLPVSIYPAWRYSSELIEQAAGMQRPSTAMLLERWRDRPEHARLTELAMAPSMVSDDKGAAQELKMAVQKLFESHGPGRRMNELLRKAAEMDLNFDEKAELSLLLKAKDRPGGPA